MIAIYEDMGGEHDPADYEPVALYNGEWVEGGEEWRPYYPEGTPEAVLAEQLTGPSTVAVKVTEGADKIRDRIAKDRVGPPQSTLLGVGDDVTIVDEEDEEEREKADDGCVYVDRLSEAPDDAIVQADVDEEGDVIDLYYEP